MKGYELSALPQPQHIIFQYIGYQDCVTRPFQTKSIKVKSKISGNRYVLAVNNLTQSADFYINKLGFQSLWGDGDWHFIVRDNVKIMLGQCPNDRPASEIGSHSYFAYLEVENIDGLYEEYQSKKVDVASGIENKPWGQREFSIRTIDGHRITFGEEISS